MFRRKLEPLAGLFVDKTCHVVLGYPGGVSGILSNVGSDGSGGPGLHAINTCWFLYVRAGEKHWLLAFFCIDYSHQ